MALAAGARLGPYEIHSAIAAGGMGEVYRATDTRLNRLVAIKVLPEHFAGHLDFKQRFEREARTLAALSHPHICPVFDVGRHDSSDFLVMEYLEGETVAQRLEKGGLPLDHALQIGIQISDALAAAHRAGIVHRDLKPGNVLLAKSGAKLLDFGLAKRGEPVAAGALSMLPTTPPNLTAQGTILGTFQYMAPEQLEGQEADARTDIFAFGTLIYEMVTGKKAFQGKSQASLIGAILKDDPRPISSFQPMSPPALDRIIKKCLAKDPDRRWQSAQDLRDELQWIAEVGSQADAATRTSTAQEARWRRPMPVLAGVLLGGIVTVFGTWSLARVRPLSAPLLSRFVVTPPKSAALTQLGGRNVIISPDGRRIVYVGDDAERGRMLFVRDIDALQVRPIPGTENATDPFFSPDGAWIGFERGTSLMRVAASGGPPIEIVDAGAGVLGSAWGDDGTVIFAKDDGLYRVPAGGGSSVERLTPAGEAAQGYIAPHILPGGKAVVFYLRKGADWASDRLAVLSLQTGEQRILSGGGVPLYAASGHLVFMRGTTLMAAPFDLDRLEVTGDPVALLENITRVGPSAGQYWLSQEGTLVYRPGTGAAGGRTLVWVRRDGREEALAVEPRTYSNPRVSPDGGRVAAFADGDIWIHDVARGTTTRLTFGVATDGEPLWTPDGERVVFASGRGGTFDLFWTRADGTGTVERLTMGVQHEFPYSWGNGGRELVFAECRTPQIGQCGISVMSLEGDRQVKVLLQTEFDHSFPKVSPDGRWLAYESNSSGRSEIYVRPFPNVEGGRWQVSTGGGTEPLWGPTGNELFYRTVTSVMMVPVQTGGSPTFGNPGALFNFGRFISGVGHDYDIAPQGDRLVVARTIAPEGDTVDEMVVVQGWFEELKRRVPTN